MAGASAADATATWAPPVARRAPATPEAPGSLRESGWLAIAVAGVLLAAFVAAIAIVGQAQSDANAPWDGAETFRSDHLSFLHDPGWAAYPGRDDPAAAHGVVAHVVTYPIDAMTACTVLSGACARIGETVPPGEFSVVITYHQAGSPPVAEPVYSRPYGLDADAFVGGEPAVFEWRSLEDRAQAWWQLSPPGFPARWFEVHADIGGGTVEQGNGLIALQSLLATLVFAE